MCIRSYTTFWMECVVGVRYHYEVVTNYIEIQYDEYHHRIFI